MRNTFAFEAETLPPAYDSVPATGDSVPRSNHADIPEGLSRAQLEQVLEFSSECISCVDRHWRFTYLNRAVRELLYADDLLGETMWTRYPANLEEPFASNFRTAMEERVVTEFEAFASTLRKWMKIRAQPFDGGLIMFSTDITAQKKAEEVRDATEFQLQQVLDATTDAVISLDRGFNYTFLNRQAELLLGRDDLLGRNIWREFPSTEADEYLRRTMDERLGCEFETFNPAPLHRWFRVQTRPSHEGIVVFFRDVTDERAAQEILLAQQATLAFVQQTARVATWEIELATARLTVSRGSFPVWGRSNDEVRTWADFYAMLHPDDRQTFQQRDRMIAAGEGMEHVDYRVIDPHGNIIWLEGRSATVRDAQGNAVGLRGITMDITARKRAEALRDASARQLEQILDATSDSVVSLDRNWIMTFVNPRAQRMLGRDDLVGRNVWEEYSAAVGSQIYSRYYETMETGKPNDFEEFYPEPLNTFISIQARASAEGIVVFSHDVTEERLSRRKLLEQQEKLIFIQQAALVATWIIDLATSATTISEGSYPVFGVPNEQIMTIDDFYRLVHSADLPIVQDGIREGVANKTLIVVDFRVVEPDGGIRWLEGRGIATCNQQGEATHLRGMTTDITARKQDEQNLRASEERYRVLSDLNPQALWAAEPDGKIAYANQEFMDYTGHTLEDFDGNRWLSAFHPGDQGLVAAAWTRSILTGEEYAIEARLIRACDGAARWWSQRALPIRDEGGAITLWLGVSLDIHDTRTAAEALRLKQEETERQRAELETIYRIAPIGLALFDPVDFRYLRLNDRQAEIVGMSREELIGRSPLDIASIEGAREMFEAVAAGNYVHDLELEGELPSRPGERRFWVVNWTPVFAADGTVQAIAGSSQEITHQKKAEAALIQSEKLAAVGRLASSISHEINNPLEAITNLLYILSTDPALPTSAREYVTTAQSELSRVSQIVTQTLRFHRQAVDRTWVTAMDLVGSVLNLYQGRLSNSGIEVEATFASGTPIFCYENDIRQVLNNLIANAIDAMRGGGRLVVRAHDTSLNGGGVRLTIADTGHGMSSATMARIFEPFYTTKDLNGTGLGLWISKGIVEHHAGSLRARSCQKAGHQGTVFSLQLPLGK